VRGGLKKNNPVISQINKITDCTDDLLDRDIPPLIKQLSDSDGFVRMQALEVLICIAAPAVTDLIHTRSNANSQLRWQVITVLDGIHNPAAVHVLVEQLKDDNAGIRWAAADALIALRRDAIHPLLEALMRDFDSLWLRQSAHHILHVMEDAGKLNEAEEKVFEALEELESAVVVPWAAEKALESLRHKKR